MTLTPEHSAVGLMSAAIAWLVAELVRRQKTYDAEKTERQAQHQAHIGDLNEVIRGQKETIDRFQASAEKQAADALVQERASMTVMLAMGDKFAALSTQMQQTVNTFIAMHKP